MARGPVLGFRNKKSPATRMCMFEEYRTSRHSFRYQENREGKGLSRPFARLIDDLFALDQRVRYVAVLDRNHRLVESRMRTHVASFTPEEYDRKFMGSVPPLVLDTLSQLEGQCGPLSHISVQYEKVDLIFIPHNNQIIALSLETGPLEPILRKLRDSLGVHIHL